MPREFNNAAMPLTGTFQNNNCLDTEEQGLPMKRQEKSLFLLLLLCLSIAANIGLTTYCIIIYISPRPDPEPLVASSSALSSSGAAQRQVPPTAVCVLCHSLGLRRGSKALHNSGLLLVEGKGREGEGEERGGEGRGAEGREGEDLCCQENAESLQLLLQLLWTFNRSRPGEAQGGPKADRRLPNPSAHLYLDERNNFSLPLSWTDRLGSGTAHTSGNAIYLSKTRRLYIPEDGLYFVYNALTFKTRQDLPSDVEIVHSLESYQGDELLMRKSTVPGRRETFTPSFLSGSLRLREGDMVGVAVSNVTFVYNFWATSYFGLVKISD